MGLGKGGLFLAIIGGIGLATVWFLNKEQNVDIPQIELVAITFGGLFILGLWLAHYGGMSHLRKHGYTKR